MVFPLMPGAAACAAAASSQPAAARRGSMRFIVVAFLVIGALMAAPLLDPDLDRKSTRLNSSHGYISYAVFCLKKKKKSVYRCLSVNIYSSRCLRRRRCDTCFV